MTHSDILYLMMGRLGNRQAPLMRAACLVELNLAIRRLERAPVKPWFLEETLEGVATVANQGYITLPADFLMEVEEGTFEVDHSIAGWTEMVKVSRERLRKETAAADNAFPEGYAIWGQKMLLGPTPDAAYDYRLDYYKRTGSIVDNNTEATNSWLLEFPDYVIYKALIIIARDRIASDRMATNFTSQFRMEEDHFMREVEARRISGETLLLTNEE